MFAVIPLVPEFFELVIVFVGTFAWGYSKGRRRRRLNP